MVGVCEWRLHFVAKDGVRLGAEIFGQDFPKWHYAASIKAHTTCSNQFTVAQFNQTF
jgi:hypothetical protein